MDDFSPRRRELDAPRRVTDTPYRLSRGGARSS
jgi:hypothetical protein